MVYFGKTVNLSSTTETWTPKYVGEELEVHEITGQGRLKIVCGNAISEHFITGRISSIRMIFVESVIFSLIDGNEVSLHGVIEDNRAAESDHQEDNRAAESDHQEGNRGQSEHQSINDNTKLCNLVKCFVLLLFFVVVVLFLVSTVLITLAFYEQRQDLGITLIVIDSAETIFCVILLYFYYRKPNLIPFPCIH